MYIVGGGLMPAYIVGTTKVSNRPVTEGSCVYSRDDEGLKQASSRGLLCI